jgi:hypothetical protein
MQLGDAAVVSLVAILIVVFLAGQLALDRLFEHQATHHPKEWTASGRPIGGKESGRQSTFWAGRFSRVAALGWVFLTPKWVKGDPVASRLLLIVRFCTLFPGALVVLGLILRVS